MQCKYTDMASSGGETKDLGLQVAIKECSFNDSDINEDPFLVSSKVGYSLRLYTDKRLSSQIIETAISMILPFSHTLLASWSAFHLFSVRLVINISFLYLYFIFSLKCLSEYPSSPSKNVSMCSISSETAYLFVIVI